MMGSRKYKRRMGMKRSKLPIMSENVIRKIMIRLLCQIIEPK